MPNYELGTDSNENQILKALNFMNLLVVEADLRHDTYRVISSRAKNHANPRYKSGFQREMRHFARKYIHATRTANFLKDYSVAEIQNAYFENRLERPIRVLKKDSSGIGFVWFSILFIPVKADKDNNLEKVYIVIKDIFLEKFFQKRSYFLMKEFRKYQSLEYAQILDINLTRDGYIAAEHSGNSDININAIGNYTDLFNLCMAKLVHPKDRETFSMYMSPDKCGSIFKNGLESFRFEVRCKSPDGMYRWYSYYGKIPRERQGSDFIVSVYVTDINDCKAAMRTKQAENDKFREIISDMYNCVIDLNLTSGEYSSVFLCPALEGVEKSGAYEDIMRFCADSVVIPEDRAEFCRIFDMRNVAEHFARGEHELYSELRIADKDGVQSWIRIRMRKIDDTIESDILAVVLVEDITNEKLCRIEQENVNKRYNTALRTSYDCIFKLDTDAGLISTIHNNKCSVTTPFNGYPYMEFYKHSADKLIFPADAEKLEALSLDNLRKCCSAETVSVYTEFRINNGSGEYSWVSVRVVRLLSDGEKNKTLILLINDINEIKEKEIALRQKEQQYDVVLRESFDRIYRTDMGSLKIQTIHSRDSSDITNEQFPHDEYMTYVADNFVHSYDKEIFFKYMLTDSMKAILKNNEETYFEYRRREFDEEYTWYSALIRRFEQDCSTNVLIFIKNIDEKKKAENLSVEYQMLRQQMEYQKQLRISNSRYKIIVKQTGTAVFEWIRENNYYYASATLPRYFRDAIMSGRGLESILTDEYVHADDVLICDTLLNEYRLKNHYEITCRMLDDNERYRWYKLSITNIFNEVGELDRMVGTLVDVDEVTKAYETLRYRAEYDALTGAPNIQKFYADASEVLKKKGGKKYAILRFDIEKFKVVNELYGRTEGDKILKYVTFILRNFRDDGIIFGRMNSDVYCILMQYRTEDDIIQFINTLTGKISEYPLEYKTKVYFGIFKVEDDRTTISTMCDWAGLACQIVKGSSIKNYFIYDDTLRNQIVEEKNIEDSMYSALANNQFKVFLQPKYNIENSEIIGAEALARWVHPQKGIMPPSKFVPLFEKNGFIIHLDEYIWEEICRLLRRWIDMGIEPVPISVNVSRMHVHNHNFYNVVTGLCEKYAIPHSLLELEITESTFFGNIDELFKTLLRLQASGFTILMDDFGSGYSSLNMLKNVPVDIVKIDREFFNETVTTERGKIVIRSTIAMAKELNMDVIAEGVETPTQAEFLLEAGCSIAQGYYFSKPIPVDEFEHQFFARKMHD